MELKDIKKYIIVIEQDDQFYQGKGTYTLGSFDYYEERGSNEWVDLKDLKSGANTINDIELFNEKQEAQNYWNDWFYCMYNHFANEEEKNATKYKIVRLCDIIKESDN